MITRFTTSESFHQIDMHDNFALSIYHSTQYVWTRLVELGPDAAGLKADQSLLMHHSTPTKPGSRKEGRIPRVTTPLAEIKVMGSHNAGQESDDDGSSN
ncbi:hypothetical protein E6O75_ATG11380 [Venturia nashicola]|uniref:Uncharacterized protein n=1 Tax=Venturia nashicola TaxID=86259 RepID=A0A4Z1NG57_9PEZI|nr:hypothetical protein E6O75_ATG11380 [Venturia nashicola]